MSKYPITVDGKIPSEDELARILAETDLRPYPQAADRKGWQEIASRPHVAPAVPRLIAAAEAAAGKPSTFIRATDYATFERTGDRTAYQSNASPRRSRMALFCMAECLEHKGRFLDALLDESWLIAEETSWVMSAHMPGRPLLPDAEEPVIDLAVAMVGRMFAETLYLLGEEMDAVTPLWRKRVLHELRRRCAEPFLKGGFWWETCEMNWNSVCHGGVASAVLLAEPDVQLRARVLHKTLDHVRHFLKGFTPDGGCSEGASYWRYGFSWFCALAYYVEKATGGQVDLLADPIVKPILEYPTKVILTDGQVVNFADCGPRVRFTGGAVAWAATWKGVDGMAALASLSEPGAEVGRDVLDTVLALAPRTCTPPRDAWLPDLEVLNVRGKGAEGEQLVLAAKGGHNGEWHNHNDVGQFIVHSRGESLVCDLGAPFYSKQTFSPRRYELLAPRALGHNVPLVCGVEQPAGKEYRARDVQCSIKEDAVTLSMDIAGVYPAEAGLSALTRTLILERGASECVELTDEVRFSRADGAYQLPLYTEGRFEAAGEGRVRAVGKRGSLTLEFDPKLLAAELEDVRHDDPRLEQQFGPTVPRCMLSLKSPGASATVRIRFTPQRD